MNTVNHTIPLAARLLLREVHTGRVYRIVTPEGATGDFTMLCDINDDSWPFPEPTETVRQRLHPDAPEETKLVVELKDPWSSTERKPRVGYDKAKLEADWTLIGPLISGETAYRVMHLGFRNKILEHHAAAQGTSRQRLSRLLRRYWKRGLTLEALMDDMDRCGGLGKSKTFTDKKNGRPPKNRWPGAPLWESTKKWLNIAADWYLADPKLRTMQLALDQIAKFFGSSREVLDQQGQPVAVEIDRTAQPTIRQLRYLIYTERPYSVRRRAKLGEKGFTLTGRAFNGRADQHVSGPGDSFVIDATIADIYLVSQFDRTLIVGRPTIYFAVDVYSRLIVGIYVGFEHPSWMAAMALLINVVTPKVAFCAQYGIPIREDQWPSHYLSSRVLGDKGEMMATQAGPLIVESLGVKIENAPSGRADFKAIVERRFGIVPSKFKAFVPGYVEKDFNQRGVRDYRLDAALTIHEFTEMVIWSVLQCNAAPISDFPTPPDAVANGFAPTPLDLWTHGISTRSGTLRSFSIDEVRRSVLPRATATVTHKGISFHGVFYECPTAVRNDWFVKARVATWRVEIAYDPRDLGLIWLCDDGRFEECFTRGTNSKEFNFVGVTLAERVDLQERNGHNVELAEDKHTNLRVLANAKMEHIVEKAAAATSQAKKDAGMSKLSTKNIGAANTAEREASRLGEAGVGSDLSVGPKGTSSTQASRVNATASSPADTDATCQQDDISDPESNLQTMSTAKDKTLAMLRRIKGKQ
ncbi:Mu transposase C-terminal domain-containing protein [Ralstonia solanacearum]|uniref:Mu transposase C-terminal domain-containing protein n=1 Tax=Ralstonia solanacearum TaxID=305 RepID=UPI0015F85863|nr:Mu transposase C-terminal domain-containing protein [Ralstonia solanacearum]